MLTKNDLKQLEIMFKEQANVMESIKDEVELVRADTTSLTTDSWIQKKELEVVKKDVKIMRKDVAEVKDIVKSMVSAFDREDKRLERRIEKIEGHLNLKAS